jgi:hypothetical protein
LDFVMENTPLFLMRRDGHCSSPGTALVGVRIDAATLKALDAWAQRHSADWRGPRSRPAHQAIDREGAGAHVALTVGAPQRA